MCIQFLGVFILRLRCLLRFPPAFPLRRPVCRCHRAQLPRVLAARKSKHRRRQHQDHQRLSGRLSLLLPLHLEVQQGHHLHHDPALLLGPAPVPPHAHAHVHVHLHAHRYQQPQQLLWLQAGQPRPAWRLLQACSKERRPDCGKAWCWPRPRSQVARSSRSTPLLGHALVSR